MVFVIDNYDSFTFNLVQLIGTVAGEVVVRRNDQCTVDQIRRLHPTHIVISPGPGRPEGAGICIEVIQRLGPEVPILGVCLGHQAIGYAFGAAIVHAPSLVHGRTSQIQHSGHSLFRDMKNPFLATRYHSLVISTDRFPDELEITARTGDGVVMAVRHRSFPIDGVQFHPESILTEEGEKMIRNWLQVYS